MEVVEAIRITRGVAKLKRAKAATARAHPFAGEGYMRHVAWQADREAEALEIVCKALISERNRNTSTNAVDFLADSGGDEREGMR